MVLTTHVSLEARLYAPKGLWTRLIAEKFKLFSGAFGASNEISGTHRIGVDFENRIIGIYQKYRTNTNPEYVLCFQKRAALTRSAR